MNERIAKLTKMTLSGSMYPNISSVDFDRSDYFLCERKRNVKRLCEFIRAQNPALTEYQTMMGSIRFNGSVIGDAFHRSGHKGMNILRENFYLKNVDNLSTCEWQHATADYKKVLEKGIAGIISEIDESIKLHTDMEKIDFLGDLKEVAYAIIDLQRKCSETARQFAKSVENPEYKSNIEKLADALSRVPECAPKSFYEAVLTIYFCFSYDPDSIGTPDRYLAPFYERDIRSGVITREKAGEYLQELFLMLQSMTPKSSVGFTKGGQSHFCVGGYLPNGMDGFSEVSELIIEKMVELPTYIPQLTFRWTKTTPKEVFRRVMDYERRDPHKRIAFTNDEKRIKCYTEICGFPFERAVSYTMVGCNEPAFLGAITGGNSKINFLRSTETLFHRMHEKIIDAKNFDEFYRIYLETLLEDLDTAYDYDDKYNRIRAEDVNYVSTLFFNDCVENAKSMTQGGGNTVIVSPMCLGITNAIDSLIVVKQFVFDEELVEMRDLVDALHANWEGYDDLRMLIIKKGDFFGNDTVRSNEIAQRLYSDLYTYLNGKKNLFGYPFLLGDLLGYNEHHKWFGENTLATPDGRMAHEPIKFGLGQGEGRDRNGLSALLNSIANLDPHAIGCGATVTNISLDEGLIKNDENFHKTVDLFESYFKNGGTHFQLTYVSREDLLAAKASPDEYKNLRVRVTGFSDYFVKLADSIQDDIISRTEHKR